MKVVNSDKDYAVDRFFDLRSEMPDGRLIWFKAEDWNLPYNVGPNKDTVTSLYKHAYKAQCILDDFDLKDWSPRDIDSEEYVIALRGTDKIGIVSFSYELSEVTDQLQSLFNTIVIDRPKLEEKSTPKGAEIPDSSKDKFDIPQVINWHEI